MDTTTYTPTEEEREIIEGLATHLGEVQKLLDRAAKCNLRVSIDPLKANFFFFNPFLSDETEPVKNPRLSWSVCKVTITERLVAIK